MNEEALLICQVLYFRNLKLFTNPILSILFPSGLHADRRGIHFPKSECWTNKTGLWRHNPAVLLLFICPRTIFPAPTKREGHRCLPASLFLMANNKCQKQSILRSSNREMNAPCHFHKTKSIVAVKVFPDVSVVKNPPAQARRWFGFNP